MTDAQAKLLQALVEADRLYRSRIHAGQLADPAHRGIEVGRFNGVSVRTARSLGAAGLAETLDMGNGLTYIFLGKYQPYDEVDDDAPG